MLSTVLGTRIYHGQRLFMPSSNPAVVWVKATAGSVLLNSWDLASTLAMHSDAPRSSTLRIINICTSYAN